MRKTDLIWLLVLTSVFTIILVVVANGSLLVYRGIFWMILANG